MGIRKDASPEEITVTYLDMHEPPADVPQSRPEGVQVIEAEVPTAAFYRFLYNTVGDPWEWTERREWSDRTLRQEIQHADVEVHVLYRRGTPAGYAELDYREPPDVRLVYFGLMPPFIGQGVGRFFLDWVIRYVFRAGGRPAPERFWLHTCTLDHPRALSFYKRAGFKAYKVETARRTSSAE